MRSLFFDGNTFPGPGLNEGKPATPEFRKLHVSVCLCCCFNSERKVFFRCAKHLHLQSSHCPWLWPDVRIRARSFTNRHRLHPPTQQSHNVRITMVSRLRDATLALGARPMLRGTRDSVIRQCRRQPGRIIATASAKAIRRCIATDRLRATEALSRRCRRQFQGVRITARGAGRKSHVQRIGLLGPSDFVGGAQEFDVGDGQ